jgi:hypothetical protein
LQDLLRLSAKTVIFVIRPPGVVQMTMPSGIQYPGAFYHVLDLGKAGLDLFKTEDEIQPFLSAQKPVDKSGRKN